MLPWRQLFLKALVESPEGSSWAGTGDEVLLGWESREKAPSSSSPCYFVVADAQPWPTYGGAHLNVLGFFGFCFFVTSSKT